MAKARSQYRCSECRHISAKWVGRCPECGTWGTVNEVAVVTALGGSSQRSAAPASPAVPITSIDPGHTRHFHTGVSELDRVLGGGLVPGSVTLLAGDPGVGKSTLALGLASALARQNRTVLYVTGEESPRQTKMRAERLALKEPDSPIYVQAEVDLEAIIAQVEALNPALLVVDSIQTLCTPDLDAAPGSVSQVRECGLRLLRLAKDRSLPILLIGHVTKDGAVAGPRTLEHMVDAVLYLEGDRHHGYRILSAAKNRFGSTHEIGVFEMRGDGLVEVDNPSERLLRERGEQAPGSVVVGSIEGTRPLLVEVQALVAPTHFANPQRVAQGIDSRRLAVVIAVLQKRAGLSLAGADVFVNVAGGIRLEEPAADLGLALALASSFRDKPVSPDCLAVGEVGLGGELRPVPQLARRIAEAKRLGFRSAIVPKRAIEDLPASDARFKVRPAATLAEAIAIAIGE